jgi:hypothetical protein
MPRPTGAFRRILQRPSDGPRPCERPAEDCSRGPSDRLWIRALIPHTALSLNLALQIFFVQRHGVSIGDPHVPRGGRGEKGLERR